MKEEATASRILFRHKKEEKKGRDPSPFDRVDPPSSLGHKAGEFWFKGRIDMAVSDTYQGCSVCRRSITNPCEHKNKKLVPQFKSKLNIAILEFPLPIPSTEDLGTFLKKQKSIQVTVFRIYRDLLGGIVAHYS